MARLNYALPQGSVLSPILFSLYMADLPVTRPWLLQYAGDLACAVQSLNFEECERVLQDDLDKLSVYFKNWRLMPNPSKSESSLFHLSTRKAGRKYIGDYHINLISRNFQ